MLVVIATGSSGEPMRLENTWTTCDSRPEKSHLMPTHHKNPTKPGMKRKPRSPSLRDNFCRINLLLSNRNCEDTDADKSSVDEPSNPACRQPNIIILDRYRYRSGSEVCRPYKRIYRTKTPKDRSGLWNYKLIQLHIIWKQTIPIVVLARPSDPGGNIMNVITVFKFIFCFFFQ
ncbi:hypothetical protein MTP99_005839 [Tenebrio molitor]|nr:hypothetical protein MTP99_005839 [Tenebrio molitor]